VLDGIFWTFRFLEFRKCSAVKVRKFFRKKRNFWTCEIFAKMFGKKFGNLNSEKSSDINPNCTSISKISKKNYVKFEFLSQKNLFWVKKFGKSSEIGFSKHSGILEIVLFWNFQKLQKYDVKLELRKSPKTHSDSKTDS